MDMNDKDFYISRWSVELPITLAIMNAMADAELEYQPDPKCPTARSIVGHLLGYVADMNELLAGEGAIHHRTKLPFRNVADAVEQMKRSGTVAASRLGEIEENAWTNTNNRFLLNDQTYFDAPLGSTAWLLLSDTIHHRDQLSSYIRQMGGNPPDIYGAGMDSAGLR
jgi:uncharacterized damage-inducible protein DinB